MPTTKTFNNTSYNIPLEGELNWASLSDFLVDIADNAQTTNKQKIATRVATATPVTVLAATDCVIISDLAAPGAVAVNLPAGVATQVFTVVDGKGDAGTNNITITPAAGTINGAATYVIDSNRAGVTLVYNGTEWTVIAEFISSGDIPRNQIASGSADHVVINDGSGDLSSEAALAASRGGLGTSGAAFTGYVQANAGVFSAAAISASDLPTLIDATKIADGSVTNTEFQYIGGVTSDVQTQIGTKVTGDASSTDNAIARFDSTTGKIIQNSGVTVDDSNNVVGVVDITPTTLNSVAIADYLTTTNTKAVTNKDIDGGTASNTSRITVPKDTKANLEALTRKEATLVYASDLDKLYADDGTSLKEIGSGGSGINYLADYFTADTLGTVGSGNVTDTGNRATGAVMAAWQSTNTANISLSVSATNPLRNLNNYLFTGAGNNATGTTFVESPAFQLHIADLGKPVTVSFDIADVTADGNFDVCMVRYNSSGTYQEKISIAGNASGATPASAKLPTGISQFNGFFIANSTVDDYYALRFRRLAGTDVPRLDSNKISPDSIIQGAAITDWVSYTPTFSAAFGTVTSINFEWRRVGSQMEIRGRATASAPTTGAGHVFIPSGYTIGTSAADGFAISGFMITDSASPILTILPNAGQTYFSIDNNTSSLPNLNSIFTTGGAFTIQATIPITGWSSNVTMANRAVEEFAYNTGGTTAAGGSNTTSFAYGGAGVAIGSIASTTANSYTAFTIQWQTPRQATDIETVEFNDGNGWFPVVNRRMQGHAQGTSNYGVTVEPSTTTKSIVYFGNKGAVGSSATYAGDGSTWASISAWKWRVRKVSGGSTVGFPINGTNLLEAKTYQIITSTSTISCAPTYVLYVGNGSSITFNLTTAGGINGTLMRFKNIHSTSLTIDANSSETIDGSATKVLAQWATCTLMAYEGNWVTVA